LIETVKELAGGAIENSAIDWRALAQPENYLGETEKIIDQTLKSAAEFAR
jgi:hypothetical protein